VGFWEHVTGKLAGAQSAWGLSWDYDRFGNRRNQNVTLGSDPSSQLDINPTTNRITTTGYVYDASGNLTNDFVHNYKFDAGGRITEVDSGSTATYTYDGTAFRVKKVAGSITTRYVFSGTKVIAEYVGGSLDKEYIYAGTQLPATLDAAGTPTYVHPDHLSTRLITDSSGAVSVQQGHFPFGES
jgi:hypothetical protein